MFMQYIHVSKFACMMLCVVCFNVLDLYPIFKTVKMKQTLYYRNRNNSTQNNMHMHITEKDFDLSSQ